VLAELASTICAEDTESSIAHRAIEGLRRRGLTETWYHACPALVLAESRSCVESLHTDICHYAKPDTTFHQLFEWASQRISAAGFENLDFLGNVGHTIATRRENRFIATGNHSTLSEAPFFIFEPHVRLVDGRWGYKHENIYFFDRGGNIEEL
jgi:hypothetical protein